MLCYAVWDNVLRFVDLTTYIRTLMGGLRLSWHRKVDVRVAVVANALRP